MTRLPGLVRALARFDSRGEATIAHIARRLRDAKRISSEKRGVGASHMTMKDAVTLLMAAIGDTGPHGAPEAVDRLRLLEPVSTTYGREVRKMLPPKLAFLRKQMNFSDTVEQLLVHAPEIAEWHYENKELWFDPNRRAIPEVDFSMLRGARNFHQAGLSSIPSFVRPVRVVSYVPGVAAEIHIGLPWREFESDEAGESPFHEYYAPPPTRPAHDRAQVTDGLITIEFGLPTLLALHEAVEGRD